MRHFHRPPPVDDARLSNASWLSSDVRRLLVAGGVKGVIGRSGPPDGHPRSSRRGVADLPVAVRGTHDRVGNCQAQTGALVGDAGAVEAIEYLATLRGRDPGTAVFHDELHPGFIAGRPLRTIDEPRRRVPHRVVQQHGQKPRNPFGRRGHHGADAAADDGAQLGAQLIAHGPEPICGGRPQVHLCRPAPPQASKAPRRSAPATANRRPAGAGEESRPGCDRVRPGSQPGCVRPAERAMSRPRSPSVACAVRATHPR